jgi:hypothetical protein
MYRGCGRRGHPVTVDIEVDIALEDVEGLGVLPMKVEAE